MSPGSPDKTVELGLPRTIFIKIVTPAAPCQPNITYTGTVHA
jgi:hypothetical protein